MRMKKLVRAVAPAFAATLLGACATAPTMHGETWSLEPVMKVRHSAPGAAGYYALGRYEEHRSPADRALAAYKKAVEAEPAYVPAWDALGTLQARLGRVEEAVRALERAVSLAPTASRLHNNLGYALLLAGNEEAAADTLRRAVQLDGENRRAWHNLAEAYRRLGDESNAELAEARADGRWPGATTAPVTAAATPMPARTPASSSGSAAAPLTNGLPQGSSSTVVTAPPAQTRPTPRLEKVAENIYALRTGASVTNGAAPAMAVPVPAKPVEAAPEPSLERDKHSSRPVRFEISNGHGATGLARRIATLVRGHDGVGTPRLTNQRPFMEPVSVLQYRAGYRAAAETLAARLPFSPTIREVPSNQLASDVRLLLGRDLNTSEACDALRLCPRLAADKAQPGVAASALHPRASR